MPCVNVSLSSPTKVSNAVRAAGAGGVVTFGVPYNPRSWLGGTRQHDAGTTRGAACSLCAVGKAGHLHCFGYLVRCMGLPRLNPFYHRTPVMGTNNLEID